MLFYLISREIILNFTVIKVISKKSFINLAKALNQMHLNETKSFKFKIF